MAGYRFHSDPGHGWLEVPRAEVEASGARISGYSYQSPDGRTLYLEEDCDAGAFLQAAGLAAPGLDIIQEVYHRGDAPCRGFRHYAGRPDEPVEVQPSPAMRRAADALEGGAA